jgi:glycerophosphoryl diester phosphodiesterase
MTADAVAEAGDRGLPVAAWGVGTEADVARAVEWELDRVICDRPDVVLGLLYGLATVKG